MEIKGRVSKNEESENIASSFVKPGIHTNSIPESTLMQRKAYQETEQTQKEFFVRTATFKPTELLAHFDDI